MNKAILGSLSLTKWRKTLNSLAVWMKIPVNSREIREKMGKSIPLTLRDFQDIRTGGLKCRFFVKTKNSSLKVDFFHQFYFSFLSLRTIFFSFLQFLHFFRIFSNDLTIFFNYFCREQSERDFLKIHFLSSMIFYLNLNFLSHLFLHF